MSEHSLVKSSIVMPAVTSDEAVVAWKAYQELADKICVKDDIQVIQGKPFKKKSFWRKVQRFFNLTMELRSEVREEYEGYFLYKFVYRAIAPNGAYQDGTGSCSSDEKGLLKTEHNTRAIAETRAKNRAIADLVGFGEVSAEEMIQDNGSEEKPKPDKLITQPQAKRLFAIAKEKGISNDELKALIKSYNYDHTKDIRVSDYDRIIDEIQSVPA